PPRKPDAGLLRWINGLAAARTYRLHWLPHDLLAGVTLSAVLVPAGMAYANAAGLPAVNGLYASLAALLAYALFGPSRILVLGPDSALVALIAASIAPLAHGDAAHALAVAGALAILAGAICIAVGVLRLGFVTELLSLPIRYGFLNGIMLTISIGQLPKLLGYKGNGESFIEQVRDVVAGIAASKVNATSFALGVAALALILACKRLWPRMPGVLLAVAGATAAVMWFDLSTRAGVATVGAV
ncbi:SulP family inorganic anion transporter, partial [Burkholderia ubonensis]